MTSEFFKKYLSPSAMSKAVVEVIKVSKLEHRHIALCGGVAMQIYGSDRLTTDVDFLSDGVLKSLKLKKHLSFGGNSGVVQGVPVDVILRDDDYGALYDEALDLSKYNPDAGCNVVTPPYLAAMKLAARREKDELDLKTLIESGSVDVRKAKEVIGEHLGRYAVDEFESYVREVRLMGKRSK